MRKTLLISLLFILSSMALAHNDQTDITETCKKQFGVEILTQTNRLRLVNDICLVEDYVTRPDLDMANLNEFLRLEESIGGEIYDLHHVSAFYIYKISKSFTLGLNYITIDYLKSLAIFGIDELGVYETDDIYDNYWDILDTYRGAETVSSAEIGTWLKDVFFPKSPFSEDGYAIDEDELLLVSDDLAKRELLYDSAISTMVKLLVKGNRKISIYPILDNNNENVADAQWVIVGSDYVVLLNKVWWL